MQVKFKALVKDIEAATGNGLADLRGMTSRRTRLAGSAAAVLALHALFLWMLIAANPTAMRLPPAPDEPLPVELFEPIPPPEPVPVERTEQVPDVQPRQVQPPEPQPQPIPQTQPQPQSQPAPYTPLPKPVAEPRDSVDAIRTPAIKTLNDNRLKDAAVATPTLDAEPDPALKARQQDTDKVESKKTQLVTAPSANDLDLHDAPLPVVKAAPETGLTDNKAKGATSAGGAPGGAASGQSGIGLKGRGAATQALQNHENCAIKQIDGKPVPVDCNMKPLTQMTGLGTGDPASRAYYGPIVAKKEADARYKADPGNADYWKRVNAAPSPRYEPDDQPRKGAYSNEKDQRVLGSCGQSDGCGTGKK